MSIGGWAISNCYRGGAIVTAAPFTLACWCYPTTISVSQVCMMAGTAASGDGSSQFRVGILVGNQAMGGSGASSAQSSTLMVANTWQNIVGVYNSTSDKRVYLNGGSKGTDATASAPSPFDRVSIGLQDNAANSRPFNGRLAHCAIWNVSLSDAEAALVGKGISPLLVRRDALVAYWPLFDLGSSLPSIYKAAPLTLVGAALTKASNPGILMPRRKLLLAA